MDFNDKKYPLRKYVPHSLLLLLALIGVAYTQYHPKPAVISSPSVSSVPGATPVAPSSGHPVKNIIFMIGDGMGVQQVSQALLYRQLRKPSEAPLALELMLREQASGLMRTSSHGDIVTDSAAAATAMACGQKVLNETVGLDANGYPCETILEKAKKMGKSVGLVSTTRITHATPASFAAHQVFRDMENEIAEDMIEKHDIDVMLSGGLAFLIPQYKDEIKKEPMKAGDIAECQGIDATIDGKSRRQDQKNLIAVAKGKGFQFVCSQDQLNKVDRSAEAKVLGLFSASVFPMIQERRKIPSIPDLAELTRKALDLLDRKPNGFFLMVEGGLIDYAGHDNDAGTMLQETLDFDQAIRVAIDYVSAHPDTLLIVTADHETGGFGFAYGKKIELEMALPSGLSYHKPYDFAAFTKFDYLIEQKKSFRAILEPILKRLYPEDPAKFDISYTLDVAAKELIEALKAESRYELSLEAAKRVLFRQPGAKDAAPEDFSEFYVHASIHPDLLGRETAAQSHAVWAAGTHTSTPVWVMAMGPAAYRDQVKGFIDNTDLAKIMESAFTGK